MATGITDKDVWKAADEVLEAGERPTIERIRGRLGRGSPNTVNEHLNAWYTQLASRIRDLESFTPASSIPEPVGQAARHFWEVAQSVAREETAAEQSVQRAALLEDQQRLAEAQADLEAREKSYEARASALDDALALARTQLEAANVRIAALESNVADTKADLADARQLELRLRAEVGDAVALLNTERAQAEERRMLFDERLDQANARAAQEIDQAREIAKQNGAELLKIQAEFRSIQMNLAERLQHLNQAQADTQAALRDAGEAQRALTELQVQIERERVSTANLQTELLESRRSLEAKDQEHGALLKQLVAAVAAGAKPLRKRATRVVA